MSSSEKLCLQCAEEIKSAAIRCRFCGYDMALNQKTNSGIPARRILYTMALAAFIVSGIDLAGAFPGSPRQLEGYLLTATWIILIVTGVIVQIFQRRAGDKRSDRLFWIASASGTLIILFFALTATA